MLLQLLDYFGVLDDDLPDRNCRTANGASCDVCRSATGFTNLLPMHSCMVVARFSSQLRQLLNPCYKITDKYVMDSVLQFVLCVGGC